MAEEKKMFGKYNQIVMLFITFLFTGVMGGWLQHIYWTKQEEKRVLEEEIDDAKLVYKDVLNHHYDLVTAMFSALHEYREAVRNEQNLDSIALMDESEWGKYKSLQAQYESDYPKYFFLIPTTFGIRARQQYTMIHERMQTTKKNLNDLYSGEPEV
ncbi:MAG: hypothetical protein N4A46_15760, partial [Schleiferiaceae bacterium]|nr:hypothetical protein [Schleiferiaceae bacterium]